MSTALAPPPVEQELSTLRTAHEEAYIEYVLERKKTDRLLDGAGSGLRGVAFEAFVRQETIAQRAFERYRQLRRAYLDLLEETALQSSNN